MTLMKSKIWMVIILGAMAGGLLVRCGSYGFQIGNDSPVLKSLAELPAQWDGSDDWEKSGWKVIDEGLEKNE